QEGRPRARRLRLRGDLNVAIGELVAEALILRRHVCAEGGAAIAGRRRGQSAGDLVARDDDRLDLALVQVLEELRELHLSLVALEGRRELPDQDPHHDEDHPEQQALEGRVQPGPPKYLTLKSITPCAGSVTRNSSATACPTTHTIRSRPSTTSGTLSRSVRGTFLSTKKSCSLRAPGAPSGLNRSPARRLRTASGSSRRPAATPTSRPRPTHLL